MEETLIVGRLLNKFHILLWNFKAHYPANNVPLVYHFLTPINNSTHSRTIFHIVLFDIGLYFYQCFIIQSGVSPSVAVCISPMPTTCPARLTYVRIAIIVM